MLRRVHHIVMEYSPGPWESNLRWSEYSDLAQMLVNLQHRSYTILHVHDGLVRKPLLQESTWAGSLDPLEEVTPETMQYDLADARLLQAGKLGCPKPQELLDFSKWVPPVFFLHVLFASGFFAATVS